MIEPSGVCARHGTEEPWVIDVGQVGRWGGMQGREGPVGGWGTP